MNYQEEYDKEERYEKPRKSSGGSGFNPMGLAWKIISKVFLSPFVFFILGYFYFDQSVQKGVLTALYFYTAFTILHIALKIFGIFTSMVTFRFFKFIKRSIDLIIMIIFLVIYWMMYSFAFGANFQLF